MEIETTRSIQPIYKYLDEEGKEVDCVIPFSCENKFNVFIRDMNKSAYPKQAMQDIDQNLCIYMKGAPERILARCSRILINGNEVQLTD